MTGPRSNLIRDWCPVAVVPPLLVIGAATTGHTITALGVLAAVIGSASLAARRHVPVWGFAILLTSGIILNLWLLKPGNVVVALPMIGLFDLAQHGDRRRSLWLGVITVPCVAISVIPFNPDDIAAGMSTNLLLCLLAIAGGELLRTRQESADRMAHAREQETLRRVGEERLQIAREIHDTVAHAMTAINVQAGVAAHLLERNPSQAYDALRSIKRTSGEALGDLRATLEVLRDPDQAAPIGVAAGLSDLEPLAAGLRAAGVLVEVEVEAIGELPEAVSSAGYRIIQESLTNVARHSRASHARVCVRRTEGTVTIEVDDDGAGRAAEAPDGNGLRGMRERALALGGSLQAAPAGERGWRVLARLPVARVPA